jgi:exosortase family protein XrtF
MNTFYTENKIAILFIVKFAGIYLVFNTLYGFYVSWYSPAADPITIEISRQVARILSFITDVNIFSITDSVSAMVSLQLDSASVVKVYEGCNGINVMIVYASFLLAFKGTFRSTVYFMLAGLLLIYGMNLMRVALLFEVAYYFPDQLYFFHKFFFTGLIYLVVFAIWFFWINHVRKYQP